MWRVRGLAEPFYVLCGYGQSGSRLARALDHMGNRLVVVEPSPVRTARIAMAGEDGVNQAIAIGARVLNPAIPIVARAKSRVAKVNLESFGGVEVINPFETFAFNL